MEINTLQELKDLLNGGNSVVDNFIFHEVTITSMKIEKNTISLELLLGEIHAYWMKDLFKNIWGNPRNNDFYLILKFNGTKILYNDIRTENHQKDIAMLDILDGELVSKNRFRFKFEQGYTDDDNNEIYYSIEFEFYSFEWDVIGEKIVDR